jgi:hypothetical protein
MVTAHYNYALFQYEILNKKEAAIQYLKEKHHIIVDNLDVAYRLYVDTYPLMELMFDTIQSWLLIQNLAKEHGSYNLGKDRVDRLMSKATVMIHKAPTVIKEKDKESDREKEAILDVKDSFKSDDR